MSSHGHHGAHGHTMNSTDHSPTTSTHGGHDEGIMHRTGHGGQHSMFFHFNKEITVLFEEWEISSATVLIGSCVAIFVLAVLYEGMKQWRERLARKQARPRPNQEQEECNDPESAITSNGQLHCMEEQQPRPLSPRLRIFTCFHIFQTLMHILQVVVGYILMLVVMTFNVWLCLAVVAGAGLGYFIMAGLLAERVYRPRFKTKKRDSVIVLKTRPLLESENPEKGEEVGNTSIESRKCDKGTNEKDDNENTEPEETASDGHTDEETIGTENTENTSTESAGTESTVLENAGTEDKGAEKTADSEGKGAEKTADTEDKGAEKTAATEDKGAEKTADSEDKGTEKTAGTEDKGTGKSGKEPNGEVSTGTENPAFEADTATE